MTTVMMDRNYEPHYRDSQQVPITSGVISNSDEHHYRQQQDMKHQMQREYQDYVANPPPDRPTVDNPRFSEPQMSPRKPVYYRVTTPDMGLPLGRYEQQRKALDDERQRDYNKLLQKINAKESQIREERRRNWSYPHETAELYDYDKEKQRLREERRQEYEEFRKHKAEMERYKPPPTPPGMGLPVGQYEQYRKMLKDQLVAEYKNSLKQPNRKHDPKPPTPPGGLSIPFEEDRQRNMRENKRMYAEDLLRQKDEQLLNRAQHEMGIPVIDRSNQPSPAHQPPPSPSRRDPRGYRGPPDGYVPSAYDPNAVPRSPGNWQGDRHGDRNFGNDKTDAGTYDLNLESYKPNPYEREKRQELNRDYNNFIQNKQREEAGRRREKFEEQQRHPPAQVKLGNYYNHEQHDKYQQKLQEERRHDYQQQLAKLKEEQSRKEMLYASKATEREQHEREARESPPIIPKGDSVDKRRNSLLKDLRSDYQHYLEKQPKVNRDKDFWQKTREPHIYPIDGEYEQRRGKIRQELRADFMKFMEKQTPPKERKKDFGEQGGVLFDPQYSKQKEVMTSRRRQEFQDYLQKKRSEVPRRNVDPAFDNHTMFSEMGGYAQQRDKINQQRSAEYNQYIKEGGWYDSPDGARNREPQYRNDDNQRNREY